MAKPVISIIIATFNSENLLPKVLESLKKQTFPKSKMEIILVDGGSKDNTFKIAKKYKCKIINNLRTEPVYGKFLGLKNARGKYVMYLDHDEVLKNKNSLKTRLSTLADNKNVKALVGSGYLSPKNSAFISRYINEFGDPFSYFMYKLSKDHRFLNKTMKMRYEIIRNGKEYYKYNLHKPKDTPIFELVAAGGMFDREFLVDKYPKILRDYKLIPHISNIIFKTHPEFIIMKNDPIIHYSSETVRKFLVKIDWRIRNNIYHKNSLGLAGFTGREKYQNMFTNIRKYTFLFYGLTLVPLILDSLRLAFSRKDSWYFLHVPLTLFTIFSILYHSLLHNFGYSPILKNYDGTIKLK